VSSAAAIPAGLGILSLMEKSGQLRRVTRLDEPAAQPLFSDGTAMMAAALMPARESSEPPTLSNTSIIEFDPSQDVRAVARELSRDPMVESASLVPVRYLVARAARRPRKKAPRAGAAAVPPPANTMWNLNKIRWSQAAFTDAKAVKVAVLDTGVDRLHP